MAEDEDEKTVLQVCCVYIAVLQFCCSVVLKIARRMRTKRLCCSVVAVLLQCCAENGGG